MRFSQALINKFAQQIYYHGTSTALNLDYKLLPPSETGVIQEKGRKKNLNKIFFTKDIGSANIYAGRAVQRFGGEPIIYRVIPMGEITKVQGLPGTTVYMSDGAFMEEVNFNLSRGIINKFAQQWIKVHSGTPAGYIFKVLDKYGFSGSTDKVKKLQEALRQNVKSGDIINVSGYDFRVGLDSFNRIVVTEIKV
jgi:hypothetical protein